MIWQNSKVKQLIWENQAFVPIPKELLNKRLFIWDINFDSKDPDKDFSRFSAGQKVMHVSWSDSKTSGEYDNVIDARIATNTLEWGNTANSFDTMFTHNNTITVFTNKVYDLDKKLVTIGNDQTYFFAKSFVVNQQIGEESYLTRIELVKVKYYMEEIANDGIVGFPFNIMNGKWGGTVKVPGVKWDSINKQETVTISQETVIHPTGFEFYTPESIGLGGIDVVGAEIDTTTYKGLTHYPEHDEYTLAPTQFKLFSVDNYGISGQGDMTNTIKALMFTEQLGQTIGDASSLIGTGTSSINASSWALPGASALGALGKAAKFVTSATSLGSAFYSDRGKLATQSAITTKAISDDSSYLKLFFEEDMEDVSQISTQSIPNQSGNLGNLVLIAGDSTDNLEINRSKGTAEVSGSSLLPEGFDPATELGGLLKGKGLSKITKKYQMLGENGLKQFYTPIPWMFAPQSTSYPTSEYSFNAFINVGPPRMRNTRGSVGSIIPQNRWNFFVRSNVFRPDAYSWWNWPILYPSVTIGVYDTIDPGNSVVYDSRKLSDVFSKNDPTNKKTDHWSTGITVGDITNNNVADKSKAFMSFKSTFKGFPVPERIEMMAITASEIKVMMTDEHGNSKEFRFASTGYTTGTAADYINVLEF